MKPKISKILVRIGLGFGVLMLSVWLAHAIAYLINIDFNSPPIGFMIDWTILVILSLAIGSSLAHSIEKKV